MFITRFAIKALEEHRMRSHQARIRIDADLLEAVTHSPWSKVSSSWDHLRDRLSAIRQISLQRIADRESRTADHIAS